MTRATSYMAALFAAFMAALLILALVLVLSIPVAHAEGVAIPEASQRYRVALEREAGAQYGLDAPVARFAAQIHQESAWSPTAASVYAQGLAQFTPPTAQWLPGVCPEIGAADPWDAGWSIRALICYDRYLRRNVSAATECDGWAFTLSAYNGGLGWVYRDKQRASGEGLDPARWFDNVERSTSRSVSAREENRAYVRRILRVLEPAYLDAGWSGSAACP